MSELKTATTTGDILLEKYQVERVLGVGGMGVVVAARHMKLDQTVAIKVLLPELMDDGEIMTRFEREARAAARIKSDHIAKVTDVGTLDSGRPYMVMEYLEGEDLETLLRRRRSLAIDQAVRLVLQICEVLSEAHGLGIIHRDLKPANLFCVRRAAGGLSIKVLDFGISKVMNENLTAVQGLMGSPAYMSPEQIRSPQGVDARSDIWALGVVLFQMLTGRLPFTARTLPGILTSIATEPAPSARRARLDVPRKLDAVIKKCLQKEPADRYASANELAADLAPLVRKGSARSIFRGDAESAYELVGPESASPSSVPAVAFTSPGYAGKTSASPFEMRWLGAAAVAVIALAGLLGMPPQASAHATSSRSSAVGAVRNAAPARSSSAVAAPPAPPVAPPQRHFILPSDLPIDPDPPARSRVDASDGKPHVLSR
jgi:serine/threonine-protein kinase